MQVNARKIVAIKCALWHILYANSVCCLLLGTESTKVRTRPASKSFQSKVFLLSFKCILRKVSAQEKCVQTVLNLIEDA